MKCPYCGSKESEVVETRDSEDLETIRRRRECLKCNKRFTTYERIENVNLVVIKKDGKRERFNRDKVRLGLQKACEKTVVTAAQIEEMIAHIEHDLKQRVYKQHNSTKQAMVFDHRQYNNFPFPQP